MMLEAELESIKKGDVKEVKVFFNYKINSKLLLKKKII